MPKQQITPAQWLAAVASVDDNPAVRAMASQTLEELRKLREDIEKTERERRAPAADPCSECKGYAVVHHAGHYVPGEQFVEPPSEERCDDCVGTGMREVQQIYAELRAVKKRAHEAERGEGDLGYLGVHEIVRYILGEA